MVTPTGWKVELMQDECRELSRWLAGRLGARYLIPGFAPSNYRKQRQRHMDNTTKFSSIRIRFETSKIAPEVMVSFPYVASVVGYSTIEYTAILFEKTVQGAMTDILSAWPDAVAHYTECGVRAFRESDTQTRSNVFGVVRVPEKPRGMLQKLLNWRAKPAPQDGRVIDVLASFTPLNR